MSTSAHANMLVSLRGLVVGDAFGDQLPMKPEKSQAMLHNRTLPPAVWRWTDDSNMAFDVVMNLHKRGVIVQDELALNFAQHYDVTRGYGPAVHRIMRRVTAGEHWCRVAYDQFEGQGSFGNGGAMRVAPLGAFFADDLQKVEAQARFSAEVTHAHAEGIAGAIAIAIAAAYAVRLQGKPLPDRRSFLDMVAQHVPKGEVHTKIMHARNLSPNASIQLAASALGDGRYITAQDTVAFTLWCAGGHLDNYEEALWFTLSKSGDRDTNCAIVGGIVAAHTGSESIPATWQKRIEAYPMWFVV